MQKAEKLYKKYSITDIGYKDIHQDNLSMLNRSEIHRLTDRSGFIITNTSFISKKSHYINEAVFSRCKIQLRTSSSIFIHTLFDDAVFNNSSLENCLFINCMFRNCTISHSAFKETLFVTCSFENVRTADTNFIAVEAISTDLSDVKDESNRSIASAFNDIRTETADFSFLGITDDEISEGSDSGTDAVLEKTEIVEKQGGTQMETNERTHTHSREKFRGDDKTVSLTDDFLGCELSGFIMEGRDISSNVISGCTVLDSVFANVRFSDVIFDETVFEGCTFAECSFIRCFFVKSVFTESCQIKARFYKCNMDFCEFDCSREEVNAQEMSFFADRKEETQTASLPELKTIDDIISTLSSVSSYMKSADFIDSIEKPVPETSKDDVIKFINKQEYSKRMTLFAELLNLSASAQNTDNSDKEDAASFDSEYDEY